MKRLLFLLVLLAPAVAQAGTEGCKCSDLRKLERELWEQELVYNAFREYALGNKVPADVKAMQADVIAQLNAFMKSPAGGGKKGSAGAAAGTTSDCQLVLYVGKKTVPMDEAKYRKGFQCQALPDYLLVHERKHVERCKANDPDLSNWRVYALEDVVAYHAGIADLRGSISQLASDCGWQGSTSDTKKLPGDREVPTIPTADQIKALSKALRGKK